MDSLWLIYKEAEYYPIPNISHSRATGAIFRRLNLLLGYSRLLFSRRIGNHVFVNREILPIFAALNFKRPWNVHISLPAEKEKTNTDSVNVWLLPMDAGYLPRAGKKAVKSLPFLTKRLSSTNNYFSGSCWGLTLIHGELTFSKRRKA